MTAEALPGGGPYGEAALDHLAAGWAPIPLPARSKALALKGWTGAHGDGRIFTVDDLRAAPYGLSDQRTRPPGAGSSGPPWPPGRSVGSASPRAPA